MADSKNTLLDDLIRAAGQAISRQTDAVRDAATRWQQSAGNALPGNTSDWTRAANAYLEALGTHSAEFARALWSLNQDYLRDLGALGSDHARRYLEDLQHAGRGGGRGTPSAPRRHIPMTLEAPIGHTAARTFVLENHQDGALSIGFDVSDARDAEDGATFPLAIAFDPDRFQLTPDEERAVTARLTLTAGVFQAGRRYTADVRVVGYPGLSLALDIRPTEADEAPPKPRRPAAARTRTTTPGKSQRAGRKGTRKKE
ncbi:MAG: hypothetical protein R2834_19860 [Rhodothermales bacterium]